MPLSIGRKPLESIILRQRGQDDITITYVRPTGHHRIRLAIEAPKDVLILRSELLLPPAGGDGAGAA